MGNDQRQIFVFKSTFELVYTGLRRNIGSPQEYHVNKEHGHFPTNFELAIPVEETHQRKVMTGPIDFSQPAEEDLNYDEVELSLTDNQPANLARQRVQAPKVSDHFPNSAVKLSSEVKRPSLSGDEDAQFVPVKCLTHLVPEWVIKVKVTHKEFKNWRN